MNNLLGNASGVMAVAFGLDKTWSAVNTVTAPEQTATIPGLKTTDVILGIQKPTDQAGLAVAGGRVSAADTIAVKFVNPTGGNITPTAAEQYVALVWRPDQLKTDAVA